MELGLCFNDKDDSAVAQDGNCVYEAQWDGDPGVHVLQARNATSRKVEDMLLLFSRDLNGIVCGGKGKVGVPSNC